VNEAPIFYSWQSDFAASRNFVERALERAIKELNEEKVLRIEARLDKALRGATGAIRIDDDIFERIDKCEVFVGDVTQVSAKDSEGRPTPNPNVLIELGYARKHVGWERMILPFNSCCGNKEDLPFDLDKNRLAIFSFDSGSDDEAKAKSKIALGTCFKDAIKAILALPTLKDKIREFVEQTNPEILKMVRSGQTEVSVNVSDSRLSTLQSLLAHTSITEFVEITSNGSILGNSAISNGGVNDVTALGGMHGFRFMFKNDPNSW